MNWTIIQLFILIEFSFSLAPHEIAIFIISQPDEYHHQNAEELRADIYSQSTEIAKNSLVNIYLLHELFNHPGYWTFLAILPNLKSSNIIKNETKWIILCEDHSSIDLKILLKELNLLNSNEISFYGHLLRDQEATIVHHFAFFENPQWFSYPLLRSGVVFTIPLIERLTEYVQKKKPTMDFFIDVSHELSLFIWKNIKIKESSNNKTSILNSQISLNISKTEIVNSTNNHNITKKSQLSESNLKLDNQFSIDDVTGNSSEEDENSSDGSKIEETVEKVIWKKLQMISVPFLCSSKASGCAIYPNNEIMDCFPVKPDSVYFAIKTCQKFHKDRILTIEATWGKFTVHKKYFSDTEDESIPTVSTGVPNTETGHCAKTLSILKLALEEIEDINHLRKVRKKSMIEWIFLSDDDTILSVSRVCKILGCFNPEDDIYLGERYGYRLHSKDGFNYITGGGGIAFSLPTIRKIIVSCTCPTISSPDDMIIGICLQRLGIKAIHSSKFHQARSLDYSSTLLTIDEPISFHKFWQINPIKIYKQWFKKADETNEFHLKLKSKSNNINCDILDSSHSTNLKRNFQNGDHHKNNNIKYDKLLPSSSINEHHHQHTEL